jgi:hypothetical protein
MYLQYFKCRHFFLTMTLFVCELFLVQYIFREVTLTYTVGMHRVFPPSFRAR